MGLDPKPRQLSPESVHIIYGALFALLAIAALFALMFVRSLTDDATQQSGITNSVPTINTVKVASTSDTGSYSSETAAITFTNENATNNIYVHGLATDNNGCTQLKKANAAWTLVVHRTEATNGAACTSNNNDCYTYNTAAAEAIMTEDTCTEDGTDILHQYEFTVPLQYYADPTSASAPTYASGTWTASVGVTDSAGGAATAGTDTFEVNTLNALSVTGTIDFSTSTGGSSMALGSTSTSDTTMTVTNSGNNTIDVELSGSALDCGAGYADIAVGNSHYSSAAATAYASMTALSATPTELNGFGLAKSNNGAAATSSVYWKLSIPSTGVAGTCSSTITVGANDHDGV